VQRYRAAVLEHNGPELCSLLSSEARRGLAALAAVSLEAHGSEARSCTSVANRLLAAISGNPEALAHFREATMATPSVSGHTATVLVREPDQPAREFALTKTSNGWIIGFEPAATSTTFDLRGHPAAIHTEPAKKSGPVTGAELAQFDLGRTVAAQLGCLACHRIGEDGNAGPGPNLTYVGSRLPAAAIEHAILNPTPPMPSFRALPKAQLTALVTFLSLLRS
jgi:mono/diheme cytochrome c family protein